MLNITVEQLISVCGQPTRQNGSQYYFRCPVCSAGGGDRHGDNLLFNSSKGTLKCFACNDGARQVLRAINSKFKNFTPVRQESRLKVKWFESNKDNLYNYYLATTMEWKPSELIYKYYKWDANNLDDVGYDPTPSHLFPSLTEPSLIFPVITRRGDLVGIEARAIQQKKIRHTKDMPNVLAFTKQGFDSLVICEGFKDATTFNMLYPNLQRDIATPSNGVGSLMQCLESIKIDTYKEIILVLDNDKAGDDMTKQVIQTFGNRFKDGRNILKGKKDIWDALT